MKNWLHNKNIFFYIAIFLIFVLALFLRTYRLSSVPPGFTDDELREAFSAYSIWKTGQGLASSSVFPFIFILDGYSFSPVPIYLMAPFVGMSGLSAISIKIPLVIMGILSVLGTYMLTKQLLKRESIALLASLCMACNVWAIHLSRIAHEAVFALCFNLFGAIVFISDWKKHAVRSMVLSMILFFLAFNSYDAMKLLYIPIIIILCVYKWKELINKKKLFVIIVGSVLITSAVFFYFYTFQNPTVRGSNFSIFQDTAAAAQSVEMSRRSSSAPEFIKTIYHNKVTYFADIFLRHYFYAFSFDYLFLDQEASGVFSLWLRGNLYLIELPLLLFGGLFLFAKNRKAFYLCAGMLLISALPSGIGPAPFTYETRSIFMLPWLAIFIGAGALYLVESIRVKIVKICCIAVLVVLYVYAVGGYVHQYYFEWPKNNAKYFSRGIMDVVNYIKTNEKEYPNILISNTNSTFILFYALENKTDIRSLQTYFRGSNFFNFENIHILPSCLETPFQDPRMSIDPGTMYVTSPYCHKTQPDQKITLPTGEEQWYIYLHPEDL